MLNVEEHELKMVETITKEALGEPPMLLDGDRLLVVQPFPYEMGPSEGKSQQGQQFGPWSPKDSSC